MKYVKVCLVLLMAGATFVLGYKGNATESYVPSRRVK